MPPPAPPKSALTRTVPFDEACNLVSWLATYPELSGKLVSCCRIKTELALKLACIKLQNVGALGIAGNLIEDLSDEGCNRAFMQGQVMCREVAYLRLTWEERQKLSANLKQAGEYKGRGADGRPISLIVYKNAAFKGYDDLGFVNLFSLREQRTNSDTIKWKPLRKINEVGYLETSLYGLVGFPNDFAPTIRVAQPDGTEELMVIAPALDPTRPITMQEWKDSQNLPDSVIAYSDWDKPLRIASWSIANSDQKKRLCGLLGMEETSTSVELETAINTLSIEDNDRLMLDFFHLEHDIPKDNSLQPTLTGYAKRLSSLLTSERLQLPMTDIYATLASVALQSSMQEPEKELFDPDSDWCYQIGEIAELKEDLSVLCTYEEFLRETDRIYTEQNPALAMFRGPGMATSWDYRVEPGELPKLNPDRSWRRRVTQSPSHIARQNTQGIS